MAVHERVLEAALRICRERGGWTFRPAEVAAALADLNLASVRTHVMSRCCVNAPSHHAHRWPYFRRVRRGVYEILPGWRRRDTTRRPAGRAVVETPASGSVIWIDVRESAAGYIAEIPGTTGKVSARSLDEVTERVRRIVRDRREPEAGPTGPVRLRVDVHPERANPVIEAYEKDVDRALIRKALGLSFEERLLALEHWMNAAEEIRGAARRSDRESAG